MQIQTGRVVLLKTSFLLLEKVTVIGLRVDTVGMSPLRIWKLDYKFDCKMEPGSVVFCAVCTSS